MTSSEVVAITFCFRQVVLVIVLVIVIENSIFVRRREMREFADRSLGHGGMQT